MRRNGSLLSPGNGNGWWRCGRAGDRNFLLAVWSFGGFVLEARGLRRRRSLRFCVGLSHLGMRLGGFQRTGTDRRLLDTRSRGYRFHRAIRRNVEASSLKFVGILRIALMPDGCDFRLLVARRVRLGNVRLDATLFLY